MPIRSASAIFDQTVGQLSVSKIPLREAVAFVAGLGLGMLSYRLHAAPSTGGDTVQGLYGSESRPKAAYVSDTITLRGWACTWRLKCWSIR